MEKCKILYYKYNRKPVNFLGSKELTFITESIDVKVEITIKDTKIIEDLKIYPRRNMMSILPTDIEDFIESRINYHKDNLV